jgi:hypothetical protein
MGNKKPCSPFGKQGLEKRCLNLERSLLLASLIRFCGVPGNADAARADDNVRDARAHPIFE